MKGAAGFTIVELLVVIAIISTLIAIAVPALSTARLSSREVLTLSNIRQTGGIFGQYTETYADAYPWAPEGTKFLVSPPESGEASFIIGSYWDIDNYWTALMHDVAPWRTNFRLWVGPGVPAEDGAPWIRNNGSRGLPSYRLSHTFFARPELWAPATEDDPSFYRPVYTRDVLYPASKALLWDVEQPHLLSTPDADRDPTAIVFADGHASVNRVSLASPPPNILFKPDTLRIQDTLRGAHGLDY